MTLRILPILILFALALPLLAPVPAAAAEVTVKTAESEEHGTYLTDGNGRALYLFTADTQAKGDAEAKIACTSNACLEGWPPLYADGEPQGGKGVDAGKLDTVAFGGKQVVTYNGWPLYYFIKDQKAGQTRGQDIHSFGGEWYLVTPKGTKAED